MRLATAALHGFKRVQCVAPLASLLTGTDQVCVRDSLGNAVMLCHAVKHRASLDVLASMGTSSYHAVEDAYVWLAPLQDTAGQHRYLDRDTFTQV